MINPVMILASIKKWVSQFPSASRIRFEWVMKQFGKVNFFKTGAYLFALLIFSVIAAITLAVCAIPIILGAIVVLGSLIASGIFLLVLKITGIIDKDAKAFFLGRMWHWAIEIPSRISVVAYHALRKVPVLGYVLRDIESQLTDQNIVSWSDRLFKKPKYKHLPAVYGDLMRVCHAAYSPDYHVDLYQKVPDHLVTDDFPYSRCKNGDRIVEGMAANVLWSGLVADCFRRGLVVTLFWFSVFLCIYHPTLLIGSSIPSQPVAISEAAKDFWTPEERTTASLEQQTLAKRVESFRSLKMKSQVALFALPADGLVALLLAGLIGFGSFRGYLKIAAQSRMAVFAGATPDAEFEYFEKTFERKAAHDSIVKALKTRLWDVTKVITLGISEGWLAAKNAALAAARGVRIGLSMVDCLSHLGVFGGPGSGKTRYVLTKFVKQLCFLWKSDPSQVHIFLGDDKGVWWRVIAKIFDLFRMPYYVIGVNTETEYSLDLYDGAKPDYVTNTNIAVLKQNDGGAKGDAFFSNAAELCIYPSASILEAVNMTDYAIEYAKEHNHLPYSPAGLLKFTCDVEPFAHADKVIRELIDAIKNKTCCPALGELVTPELWGHIEKMTIRWRSEAGAKTRDSIIKTVETVLEPFCMNSAINAAFGTGMATKTVTIDDLRDHHFLINMPSGELNKIGSMVNSMIYMRLFYDVARNQINKTSFPVQMIVDEAQEQICCSGQKGAKDWATVPGMCREQLLSISIGTQSIDSIRQNIGDAATKALLNNIRSRVVLAVENIETLELVTAYSPEITEYKVSPGRYPSYHALREQTSFDVHEFVADRVRLPSIPLDVTRSCWNSLIFAREAILPTDLDQYKPLVEADLQFVSPPRFSSITNTASSTVESYLSAMGQAHWRAEDLIREIKTGATTSKALVAEQAINLMSNNKALCMTQNSGSRRLDWIDLDYDEDALEAEFSNVTEAEAA